MRVRWKNYLYAALALAGSWLGGKYLLPVILPFLLGGLVALAAEPMVSFGMRKLHLRRPLAAGIGVSLTLISLVAVVSMLAAVAVKELKNVASSVPDLSEGAAVLQAWLISVADKAPVQIRTVAQRTVTEIFNDGTALVKQITSQIPAALPSVISGVGSSVLGVGTGILASFLISVRLPKLREGIREKLPESWYQTYLPALQRVRKSLWGWLKAQGKLSLVTWCIVTAGFLLLRVPYAPAWALLVAVVDAVPILGTGTVLIPFAAISLLQGESLKAIGLLCTYGAAAITRTALEPRLIGRQLGLDPLITLLSLYAGYRFFGIVGLLVAPILASAAKSMLSKEDLQK